MSVRSSILYLNSIFFAPKKLNIHVYDVFLTYNLDKSHKKFISPRKKKLEWFFEKKLVRYLPNPLESLIYPF